MSFLMLQVVCNILKTFFFPLKSFTPRIPPLSSRSFQLSVSLLIVFTNHAHIQEGQVLITWE
jgi:hypothetical protein